MGNSLQDQLLKANLTNKKQVQQVRKQKHKARKQAKPDHGDATLKQQQEEKVARDRALNRQREEDAQRKSVVAQVRQLIEANKLSREGGESAYHFVDAGRVRKLYVTEVQQQQLAAGKLVLVKLEEQVELVLPEVAEKIAARDPDAILKSQAEQQVEEDEYAGYEVPDDLVW